MLEVPFPSQKYGYIVIPGIIYRGRKQVVKVEKMLVHSQQLSMQSIDVVCIRPERNVEALLGLNFLQNFRYCIDHNTCVISFEQT